MSIWNMVKVHKILSNPAVFMRCTCCSQKRCSWHFPSCVTCVKKTARSASSLRNSWGRCGVGFHFAAPKQSCLLDFPSAWAIGQTGSFDIALFQNGNSKTNLLRKGVPSHCLAKPGCEAPLCRKAVPNSSAFRGTIAQAWTSQASAARLYLEGEKTIGNTKPHKCCVK